ncbi:hypothetical protein GJAV_G00134110 [Gymnothorax javanicus]|nr:hypothetical protein GJAV_G00134110 [Gymnothorax javanicus]
MSQRRAKRQPFGSEKMKNNARQKESNVSVAVRVRPMNKAEKERGEERAIVCLDKHNLQVCQAGRDRCFSFDAVLGPNSSQEDLFQTCEVQRLIDMATRGYSCTVFAFGQTGSGKTYTITGPHSVDGSHVTHRHGLIHRCLSHLLQTGSSGLILQASYLEIYKEQVQDLWNPHPHHHVPIRGVRTQGFYVENPTLLEIRSMDDFKALLEEGQKKRHTSCHLLNERSSRGHTILTIYIGTHSASLSSTHKNGGALGSGATRGKLCLVDLAGSERVKLTGCKANHLEEAGTINRSLLSLGKCIAALVEARGRQSHIPYRESKLTKLLSDSLGGAGLTLMIACMSPSASSLPETLNTLYYSSQARRIKPRPSANQGKQERLVDSLKREIRLLHSENLLLRQRLSTYQEVGKSELEAKHSGSGSSETTTEEKGGLSGAGSASFSEACFLQELSQEKDKLQREVELPDCQEHSDQQRELLPEGNTQSLDKPLTPSPLTPPLPRGSSHRCRSNLYCTHPYTPVFLPPISAPGLPEPFFHGRWRPLMYSISPASCSLLGAPFPSPALSPHRAAIKRGKADCLCWKTDLGVQSKSTGCTGAFQANSSSQQAKADRPRPPRSQRRVAPTGPPPPRKPCPLQLTGRSVEQAQAV